MDGLAGARLEQPREVELAVARDVRQRIQAAGVPEVFLQALRDLAARGGYAADIVPMIAGRLPYRNIHDELVAALLAVDAALAI